MSNQCPQRRVSLASCQTCAPGAREMWFRSCLQRLCAVVNVLRFPEDNQVKVYHVPSEVGPTAAERLFKQALNSQIAK